MEVLHGTAGKLMNINQKVSEISNCLLGEALLRKFKSDDTQGIDIFISNLQHSFYKIGHIYPKQLLSTQKLLNFIKTNFYKKKTLIFRDAKSVKISMYPLFLKRMSTAYFGIF